MALLAEERYFVGNEVRKIEVPKELYTALGEFMAGEKPAGELVLRFRNGGIAEIVGTKKVTYKGTVPKNSLTL